MNVIRKKTVQSLERGLKVLEVVSASSQQVGITDLSRQLGLAKGSIARMVATLVEQKYLIRDPKTAKYQLGLKLWGLGSKLLTHMDLRTIARQTMEELYASTRETIHLSVLSSDCEMVLLDKMDSNRAVRPNVQLGQHMPAHCGSNGKALLSFRPEYEVLNMLPKKLKRFTDKTITRRSDLLVAFEEIRQRGYSINDGEYRSDIVGVAAPICDHTNFAVAALGISIPTSRKTHKLINHLGRLVAEHAQKISNALGQHPPM